MAAYYNEFDRQKAAWLRELIAGGHIAPGEVDERSIKDVSADDLRGYTQCHFFAGIGVWSYALRRAGWPDERPVWTGSCPCQGFSVAGKRLGFADERHLWPEWFRLIQKCRPGVVFGEEVAKKDGLAWLDLVSSDLEGSVYSIGAAVIPACGFGTPHLRERLYFVAESDSTRLEGRQGFPGNDEPGIAPAERAGSSICELGEPDCAECEARDPERVGTAPKSECTTQSSVLSKLEYACCKRRERGQATSPRNEFDRESTGRAEGEYGPCLTSSFRSPSEWPREVNGFWGDADWLLCTDGKWRAVEAGTFPLAYGAPSRVGRLRGYGDAIVAEVAKGFIEAYLESRLEKGTE